MNNGPHRCRKFCPDPWQAIGHGLGNLSRSRWDRIVGRPLAGRLDVLQGNPDSRTLWCLRKQCSERGHPSDIQVWAALEGAAGPDLLWM